MRKTRVMQQPWEIRLKRSNGSTATPINMAIHALALHMPLADTPLRTDNGSPYGWLLWDWLQTKGWELLLGEHFDGVPDEFDAPGRINFIKVRPPARLTRAPPNLASPRRNSQARSSRRHGDWRRRNKRKRTAR